MLQSLSRFFPPNGFSRRMRTVHAVKFHYGSPEIMRHAHDTFCTDNVRICIMSLVSGELSVDEALCDIEGDAVLERTVALYHQGSL